MNTPKHTVLSIHDLTCGLSSCFRWWLVSPVSVSDTRNRRIGVEHVECTVSGCGFVIRYQNTSNLDQYYIRGGTEHKELTDQLTVMEQVDQSIPNDRLVMTKDSPMMMTHTGNTSRLRWREVGRRQGVEEVVVMWTYSVTLVWLLWFVSKRFANEMIKWLDYQSNISKSLIIKGFDNQDQFSVWLSKVLIIKSKNPIIKSINTPKKLDMCPWRWKSN